MTRTVTDWGSLVLAELDGREPFGTTAKLIAQAMGRIPPKTDEADPLAQLLRLAEMLNSDKAIKARLAELNKASEAARAEIVSSGRERAAVDKLKADAQAEYKNHQEQMADELKQHQKELAASHAELASVKKQAADLKAKAHADAEAAAKIRADLQRRLQLITEAV